MTLDIENLIQQTDLLSLMNSQKTNVNMQSYADTIQISFDSVLDNLKTLNDTAKNIEKDINNVHNNTQQQTTRNSRITETKQKNNNLRKENTNLKSSEIKDNKLVSNDLKTKQTVDTEPQLKEKSKIKDNTEIINNDANNENLLNDIDKNTNAENSQVKSEEVIRQTQAGIQEDVIVADIAETTSEVDAKGIEENTQNIDTETTNVSAEANLIFDEQNNELNLNIQTQNQSQLQISHPIQTAQPIQSAELTNDGVNINCDIVETDINTAVDEIVEKTVQNFEQSSEYSLSDNNKNIDNSLVVNQTKDINIDNSLTVNQTKDINIDNSLVVNQTKDINIDNDVDVVKITTNSSNNTQTTSSKIDISELEVVNDIETLEKLKAQNTVSDVIEDLAETTDIHETDVVQTETESAEIDDDTKSTDANKNLVKATKVEVEKDTDNKIDLQDNIEEMIDEVDIDESTQQNKSNTSEVKENLTETLLKAQIVGAAQTNNSNIKIQQNNNQTTLQQALQSQINTNIAGEAQQTSQSNLNFTQDSQTSAQTVQATQSVGQTSGAETNQAFSGELAKLNASTVKMQAPQSQTLNKSDVLNQITTKFEQLKDGTTSKVNIILRPENLGKVGVELVSRQDGVSARILADTQQIKELLDKNLDTLKNSLQSQGVNVNNIIVKVVESTQGTEMNFAQNFDFTNQNGEGKNEKLDSETKNDLNDRKHDEQDEEETNSQTYVVQEEQEPELEEAERIYKQHSGKVDLVV